MDDYLGRTLDCLFEAERAALIDPAWRRLSRILDTINMYIIQVCN